MTSISPYIQILTGTPPPARSSATLKAVKVKVLFFGIARELAGVSEDTVEIADGSTGESLLEHYLQKRPPLATISSSLILARNQQFGSMKTTLSEGDEIAFLPPVSGGSKSTDSTDQANSGIFCAITPQAIENKELITQLQAPSDGAVVTFLGVVRNQSKGRPTRYLEYECYQPMALNVMSQLAAEIRQEFGVHCVGIVHRIGRVDIQESSVCIVVTSAHRQAALDACEAAIHRLKVTVPIWKKEYFEDGEVWVEGAWADSLQQLS